MKKINTIAYFLFFTIVFLSIVYKVFNIPITHDEVGTIIHYYNFSPWQIMMYPDQWPNNHILNTLSTKFLINIFGNDEWVVRTPNLISFLIYCYSIFRINNVFFKKSSIFIIAAISLFLSNAYLLDFFGLCRGYGMATAFVTLSSSYILSGFIKSKESDIWYSVIFAILAGYANFTTLIFWAAISILSGIYFLVYYRNNLKKTILKLSILALVSLGYLALIITPILKMTSTQQFKYWTSKGFFNDTIVSLIKTWRYNDGMLAGVNVKTIGIIVVIIFVFAGILMIKGFISKSESYNNLRNPLIIAFLIPAITISVNFIQILLLKTPNLSGRTAVFLYPLFIIVILALLSKLEKSNIKWSKYSLSIIIPIFAFMHLSNSYNPKNVSEWWYDENTFEVIDYLEKTNPEGIIKLKTHWLFYRSFNYYTYTGKIPRIELEPNKNHKVDKNTKADYYYITDSDKSKIEPQFEVVKKFGWDRWLLKKKKD